MKVRDDGENRGSSEGRQTNGTGKVEDGIGGHHVGGSEKLEDGVEWRQAIGIE